MTDTTAQRHVNGRRQIQIAPGGGTVRFVDDKIDQYANQIRPAPTGHHRSLRRNSGSAQG